MTDYASTERTLEEFARDHQMDDWDGYGATAVTPATVERAAILLAALPEEFSRPSFGAEPDGAITMEWYRSQEWLISVSVLADTDLIYVACLGTAKESGTEPYSGRWPDSILNIVRRIEAAR